jgi:tetratricopeptide (TPR) repeat protein
VARARILYSQKKNDETAQLALRAIERKPDCDGAWNILGRAYFASGRYEEAAALTERAIEFNGDDYNMYIPYRQAFMQLGRLKEAEPLADRMIKVLRQQLELVPEDVRARVLLATNLAYSGNDHEESIRHLQTAVALRPGDSNTLYNAACTYGVLGKKAEALDTLKKAFVAGFGRPKIPISIACTMTLNSRNWSASIRAPRSRKMLLQRGSNPFACPQVYSPG